MCVHINTYVWTCTHRIYWSCLTLNSNISRSNSKKKSSDNLKKLSKATDFHTYFINFIIFFCIARRKVLRRILRVCFKIVKRRPYISEPLEFFILLWNPCIVNIIEKSSLEFRSKTPCQKKLKLCSLVLLHYLIQHPFPRYSVSKISNFLLPRLMLNNCNY